MSAPTPVCPRCGQPPIMVLDEGRQAFCGTEGCAVMAWNPTQTPEELEADKKEITLPETNSRRGLLVHPDGTTEFRDITGHLDIQDAVGSTNIDWAAPGPVNYMCYGYALYERDFNAVATALYHETHDTTDPLCGSVLMLGPVVEENETDIPDKYVRRVKEIIAEFGPEALKDLAAPLSEDEHMRMIGKMTHAQDQASAALAEGKMVDFGGIQIGRDSVVVPISADDCIQHRARNRP